MATAYYIVMSTYPSHSSAEAAALSFIEKGLAACTTITPLATSIYRWQGKMTQTSEVQVFIKTVQEKLDDLEKELSTSHPYDTPEFIVLPVAYGSTKYFQWIDTILPKAK